MRPRLGVFLEARSNRPALNRRDKLTVTAFASGGSRYAQPHSERPDGRIVGPFSVETHLEGLDTVDRKRPIELDRETLASDVAHICDDVTVR